MRITKKGEFSLTEVPQLVIVFLVIAIVLGVSATVLSSVQTTQTTGTASDLRSSTATATNVSAVVYNGEFNTLACSGVVVYNGTNNKVVTSEFTLTSAFQSCTARIVGGNNTIQGKTVTLNYTKTRQTFPMAYNVTTDGLNSAKSLSGWQGSWVVIMAAAIILGIIYKYMLM